MKKKKNTYAFNILLVLFFTALVLWLALKDNFDEVMQIISQVQLSWIFIVLLVSLFNQSLIGMIIMILTKLTKKDYKFFEGAVNAIIASFFHGVTPSASGGQIAQIYVFKKQRVPVSDAVGILWMDFILYQTALVGLVLFLLWMRFTYFYDNFSHLFVLVLVGFAVNCLIIVGLYILARFPRTYRWLTTTGVVIGVKLRLIKDKEKTIANIDNQLEHFSQETKRLQSHRTTIVLVIFLNVVRLALYYSIPYFCMLALGIDVSISMILDIVALSACVSMMNTFIPLPGASGGTEATFLMMFSGLVGLINATSTMLLWRFVSYYLIMLIGGVVFVIFKFIYDKKEVIEN